MSLGLLSSLSPRGGHKTQCLIPKLELSRPQPEIWITISYSNPRYPNLIMVVRVLILLPELPIIPKIYVCVMCMSAYVYLPEQNLCSCRRHMLFATFVIC
jgi:hypothetical protein